MQFHAEKRKIIESILGIETRNLKQWRLLQSGYLKFGKTMMSFRLKLFLWYIKIITIIIFFIRLKV